VAQTRLDRLYSQCRGSEVIPNKQAALASLDKRKACRQSQSEECCLNQPQGAFDHDYHTMFPHL
jgi:hypothetical protein